MDYGFPRHACILERERTRKKESGRLFTGRIVQVEDGEREEGKKRGQKIGRRPPLKKLSINV